MGIFSFIPLFKEIPPLWPNCSSGNHGLTRFNFHSLCFNTSFSFLGWTFFQKIWFFRNLRYIKMFPPKLFWPNVFWKENFSVNIFFVKLNPPVVQPFPPGTITWMSITWWCLHTNLSFSDLIFFKERFFKDFLCIILCENSSPTVETSYSVDNDLNKLESTLREDASTHGHVVSDKTILEKY